MPLLLPPPSEVAPSLPVPAGTAGNPWAGVQMRWHGADGSEWDLLDASARVLLAGIGGCLEAPEHDSWTSVSPGQHGSRHRGSRVLSRDQVTWSVHVLERSGAVAFDQVHRAWLRSFHRDVEGSLTVSVLGRRRTLRLLWAQNTVTYARDPLSNGRGYQPYTHRLVANQPFWEGEPVTRRWVDGGSQDFFMLDEQTTSGVYTGGLFYISEPYEIGSATIDNPGEEDAYPIWRVDGPCTSVTVGTAGYEIEVPIELEAGQWVEIDTRPARQTVVDHSGGDRVADLGAVAFAPVSPGTSVPLSIEAEGTGTGFSVSASLTPLYGSAWS